MIREAERSDIPHVARLMAEVFADDAAFRSYFQGCGPVNRAGDMAPIFERQLAVEFVPEGVVDLCFDGTTLVGAACWNLPNDDHWFHFPSYVAMYGGDAYRMLLRDARSMSYHPTEPHWYLYALAVSPAAQGKGVGSRLLRHGLERATGLVYLEATTPGSQRLYERFGFSVTRQIPTTDPQVTEMGMVLRR
ncbi:GNAT family N-acetyltransferase [Corynebacterium hindlerae]|uniref:GNAT family N-acetyltransferase n=1 Tax=Corynebacterium hindlerae TaxID=699041 RepID=A0A7G5FFD1_9CORY|nr:GNAT family N-acetyltransferase [Corynebacterium hindlerae]QMV85322.1 GNAT family N-acetyltransferase [Corynebacterium hindlerae]QTH58796.1 GNAT family N-acetyltransferase [Corynebacterium hindlerae]